MNILISHNQYKLIIESHKEFNEIDIIPSMDQDVNTIVQPHIEDVETDIPYGINQYFDDRDRENLAHAILQKKDNKGSTKVIWQDRMNLDGLNDIAYVNLNYPIDLDIRLYDDEYNLHAKVKLKKFKDGYMIQYTEVYPIASGRKLGMRMYLKLSEILGKPIYSDYVQTQESRKAIWDKLYQLNPDKVLAYYRNKLYKVYNFNNIMTFGDGKLVYSKKPNYLPQLVLIP